MQFAPTEEAKKSKLELVGTLPIRQFQLEFGYGKFLVRLSAFTIFAILTWALILRLVENEIPLLEDTSK